MRKENLNLKEIKVKYDVLQNELKKFSLEDMSAIKQRLLQCERTIKEKDKGKDKENEEKKENVINEEEIKKEEDLYIDLNTIKSLNANKTQTKEIPKEIKE